MKRGFLLAEEGLKLIIAVICISFLIYFLTSLYLSRANDKAKQQAKADLSRISDAISSSKESLEISLLGPKNWELVSFVKGEEKPNSCLSDNCVCICKKGFVFPFHKNDFVRNCNNLGECLKIKNLEKFSEIKIKDFKKGLTKIMIKKINNKIKIIQIK